jgi:AraC-like DNA-binding protein
MPFPFTAYRRTSSYWDMTQPHFHNEVEILFPLTDGGSIFIDSTPHPLRKGNLFIMDAAVLHRSFSHRQTDYTRCVLHLPLSTLQQLGIDKLPAACGCCIQLTEEDFSLCRELFDCLVQSETSLCTSLLRTAAFVRLIALIAEKWDTPPLSPPQPPNDSTVEAVISYIRAHLSEALTLDRLAATFFLSKSTLCHRFKASTGFSVMEYVIHCRIQYARHLLARGCSVQHAGEAAGFGDNAHFIRSFRRITGLTPGQFSRSVREKGTASLPGEP